MAVKNLCEDLLEEISDDDSNQVGIAAKGRMRIHRADAKPSRKVAYKVKGFTKIKRVSK